MVELTYTCKHTQAKLQAKLDKAENNTNGSKNDEGNKGVQGVELQIEEGVAPKPPSGCCSML
eukprot:scaffold69582_cov58-Phaeocystis_antarctica.AAC.4